MRQGKHLVDAAVRVREVETARLRARGQTVAMIAPITGVTERQVYRDLASLRERLAANHDDRVTLEEEYLELQRAAWQDHDKEKSGQARAMHMRNLIEIQDRKAKLLGVAVGPEPAAQASAQSLVFVVNGQTKVVEVMTDQELNTVEAVLRDQSVSGGDEDSA